MALTIAKEGAVFLGKRAINLHIEVVFVDDQRRAVEEIVSYRIRTPIIRPRIFLIEIQNVDAGLVQTWSVCWNNGIGFGVCDGLVKWVLDNKTGVLNKIIREVIARRRDIDNWHAPHICLALSEALSGIVGKEEGL